MIGNYLKVVLGLIIGFGLVAAVLTLGFIVLIGAAAAGAVLLTWYRVKLMLAEKKGAAGTASPRAQKASDVLEVEYEVVHTEHHKEK